ncbi:MAG: AMP-binding protein, partial [Alcanivorax sp.]|uniref:AMP-binding protein n=1 Tax=Alcanivorax sp. TaxID=1872427 RepID=UPI003DA73FDC
VQTASELHDQHDTLLYVLTSGSTGQPKAVAASEKRLTGMLRAIHTSQHLETVNSVLACLPLGFSSGLINQLLWALYKGRALHLPGDVISPVTLLSAADQLGSEMLCFVNTQIKMVARLCSDEMAPLENVKVVNFSGESFPESHYAFLKTMFPNARLYNNYGCTEAMPRISVRDVTVASQSLSENVGSCIEGTTLRIEGNQPVGPLEFRSPWSAIGYLNESGDLTHFGEWVASGDAGRIIDGELHLSGRCDQLVKLGGERHSLKEVELAATKAGFQGAVAMLDEEKLTLIVHATGADHSNKIRTLRSLISPILRPAKIYRRSNWPLLANGKVDRQQVVLNYRELSDHQERIWPSR